MTASSLIAAARYWTDERALELRFIGGRRYLYLGIPPALATEFAEAASKGSYFNRQIRGRFPCHELMPESRRSAAND